MLPNTHLAAHPELVGRPGTLAEGYATAHLDATAAMAVDDRGLVHGGFLFGLADYAAMLAVNDPNVVLAGASEARFLAPVVVGDTLVATARVTGAERRRRTVAVSVRRGDVEVLTVVFTCAVLDRHVLDPR